MQVPEKVRPRRRGRRTVLAMVAVALILGSSAWQCAPPQPPAAGPQWRGCQFPREATHVNLAFEPSVTAAQQDTAKLSAASWNAGWHTGPQITAAWVATNQWIGSKLINDPNAKPGTASGCVPGIYHTSTLTINSFHLITQARARFVWAHEMGHALGLDHDTYYDQRRPAPGELECTRVSVMYWSLDAVVQCNRQAPNARDFNSLSPLYIA